MRLNKLRFAGDLLVMIALGFPVLAQEKSPREPQSIPAAQFDKLHRLIKPQAGESRFQEIPWLLSVWEARTKAAAEGKPILVWAGAGGAPTAVC